MSTQLQDRLLLEREAEAEALEGALQSALSGRGRLLLVEGKPGEGKTELVELARRQGRELGLDVLSARGSELERGVPFGVVIELFGRPLQKVRPGDRSVFRGAAELAANLFSPAPTPEEARPEVSSHALVQGLYWLMANLAERCPYVVTVDDAQWADVQSLRFLHYLAERLDGLPVATVVALRPEDASERGHPLARLRADPDARILTLQPLSAQATRGLTRNLFFPGADDAFCAAVHAVSGGNPFILREVLQTFDSEALAPTAGSVEQVRAIVPESVVRSARAQLAAIGPEAVRLAQAVAVLGPDAHLYRSARLARLDPEAAVVAADKLIEAGVIQPIEPAGFAHPPVRLAVYTSIPPARRMALHGEAAALLAEQQAEPERQAAHLLCSPASGNTDVVDLLRAAARRALSGGAPESAVRYLRRALAEPPPLPDRSRVLLELGQAAAMSGDPAAVEHLRRAVEDLPDAAARTEALFDVGRTLVSRGRYREAIEALEAALDEVGPPPSELRRRVLAALLQATRQHGDRRRADLIDLAWAALPESDVDGPEPHELSLGQRALQGELAIELLLAGRGCEEVHDAAQLAVSDLDVAVDDGAAGLPFHNAVSALTWTDDLDLAEAVLDRAIGHAEDVGRVMGVAVGSFRRAVVCYLRGNVDATVAGAERAIELSQRGWAAYLSAARGILALALIEQGELPRAACALTETGGDEPGPDEAGRPMFLQARATLHLVEGDPVAALEDAMAAGEVMSGHEHALSPAIVPWRSLAAVAAHQLGDFAEARGLAEEEVEVARDFGSARALGAALRVQGVLTGGAPGVELLREAAAVLADSPARLEYAKALADLGRALRRTGRTDAPDVLTEALDLADHCGAVVLAAGVRDELKGAGVRPRRRTRKSPTALTPSEQRVAELVATGLSNREVAEKLFVSVRAVEFHLGNLFTKLGISSRRQLPAVLARRSEKN